MTNDLTMTRRRRLRLLVAVATNAAVAASVPASAANLAGAPSSLRSVAVPEPPDLGSYVKDRDACVRLGKAFFWDMQAGSDGITACASCHFHAGTDNRSRNTLNPGANKVFEKGGPNSQLRLSQFPFHLFSDPTDRFSRVLSDSDDVVAAQGVVKANFGGILLGNPVDPGTAVADPIFSVNGVNTRQATPRNTPTVINASFLHRIPWDGKFNHVFNGASGFGPRDPNASILVDDGSGLQAVKVLIDNASVASLSAAVATNNVVMSWKGRKMKDVGRKLLNLRPLQRQTVHRGDSVLGPYVHSSGKGLNTSYAETIAAAFWPRYWNSAQTPPDGYSQMEANFALFWGLANQCYSNILVSNDSPFDRFMEGDTSALTPEQQDGLDTFLHRGRCFDCHAGPEFTSASVTYLVVQAHPGVEGLLERMNMATGGPAVYDAGFYNIGVRPTAEDLGVGGKDPFGNPISLTRLAQQGVDIGFQLNPPVSPTERVDVDGAFKVPTMRNVELTGPYFHNGGMATLEQMVDFYSRGGDFREANIVNVHPDMNVIGGMDATRKANLVAFLKSLTDDRVRYQKAPFDHPQLMIANGVEIPAVGASGGLALQPFASKLPR